MDVVPAEPLAPHRSIANGRATAARACWVVVAVLVAAALLSSGAPAAAWVVAAAAPVLAGVAAARARRRCEPCRSDDLARHLASCRRRGAPAAVLCARAAGGRAGRARLARELRLADSVAQGTGDAELLAVLDAGGLDRGAVVRRLRAAGATSVGWAAFPRDSVTLEGLIAHARADGLHVRRLPAASRHLAAVRADPPAQRPGTTTTAPAP